MERRNDFVSWGNNRSSTYNLRSRKAPVQVAAEDDVLESEETPFDDPEYWDIFNNTTELDPPDIITDFQNKTVEPDPPDTTNYQDGETSRENGNEDMNFVPLLTWPPLLIPYNCSCCHVIREFIHYKGTHTTKLEVHGRIGIICHAILETHSDNNGTADTNHSMIDFCNQRTGSIKKFLLQYCQEKANAGYSTMEDPLFYYYDTLCVGLTGNKSNATTEEFVQTWQARRQQRQTGGAGDLSHDIPESSTSGTNRIASQRQRTSKMTLNDLFYYFQFPIKTASVKLDVCETVLKKKCRDCEIPRWPFRLIEACKKEISKEHERTTEKDQQRHAHAQALFTAFTNKRTDVFITLIKDWRL